MSDDPVHRELSNLRSDIRDDLRDIKDAINRMVSKDVYDAHRAELVRRIQVVEDAVGEAERARVGQRRWLIGTIISCLAIVVTIGLAMWK